MNEAVIVALITGGMSLAGVVVTCLATARKNEQTIKVTQAVTDTRLDELTREVRAHNDFAQRVPVMEEKLKSFSHRLAALERQ